eukprot:6132554-Ditylum_brightwellii.AAC.1
MESDMICYVPCLGTYWFNEEALTNIIRLKDMADKFCVTYDSESERAMYVHLTDKIIKFKEFSNGMYAQNLYEGINEEDKSKSPPKTQMFNTIDKNLDFLLPRQLQRAKKARKLYGAIRTPT